MVWNASTQRNWINFMGIVSIAIVFFYNYMTLKNTFTNAFLETVLNFDKSLTQVVDSIVTGGTGLTTVFVILAHLYLYVWIFLLFNMYILPNGGIMNIIWTSLFIMALHVVHFTFVDNNPLTLDSIVTLFPFSGLFHLLTNLDALSNPKLIEAVTETINNTNVTNITSNLDLT